MRIKEKKGKKILSVILIVFLFILSMTSYINFGGIKAKAADFGTNVTVSGANELPQLFTDEHVYDQRSSEGNILYCLNPNEDGSETVGPYPVTARDGFIIQSNFGILASIAQNGYPNVTWSGYTGLQSQSMTAIAVRYMMLELLGMTHGRSAEDYAMIQNGDLGAKRTVHDLIVYAKANPVTAAQSTPTITLAPQQSSAVEYPLDKTRIGIKYNVSTFDIAGSVPISISGTVPQGIQYQSSVSNGQSFWVTIPKSSATTSGSFDINANFGGPISASVFFETTLLGKQSYIGQSNPTKNAATKSVFSYQAQTSDLKITKVDKDTGELVKGVVFRVWGGANPPADTNTTTGLIGEFTTDVNGEALISNILPDNVSKKLYIQEIKAPDGYNVIDTSKQAIIPFTFDQYGNTGTNAYKLTQSDLKKQEVYKKVDDLSNATLANTTFKITYLNGKDAEIYKDGALVSNVIVTGSDGKVSLGGSLKDGDYYLQEVVSSENYINDHVLIPFTVNSGESTQLITKENTQVKLDTFIQKQGINQIKSNQAFTYGFTEVRNESNVPLSNFQITDTLQDKYYHINSLTLPAFTEKEGYSLYLMNGNNKSMFKVDRANKDDQLESNSPVHNTTRDVNDILENDIDYSLASAPGTITGLEYNILPTSKMSKFTIPAAIVNKIADLQVLDMKDNWKDIAVNSSIDLTSFGTKVSKIKVIFKVAVNTASLSSGTFDAIGTNSNTYNLSVGLSDGTTKVIKNIDSTKVHQESLTNGLWATNFSLIFNNVVRPTFQSIDDGNFHINGLTTDVEQIVKNDFGGDINKFIFANTVKVGGSYIPTSGNGGAGGPGVEVTNSDEVDTVSVDKNTPGGSNSNKLGLPATGEMTMMYIGIGMLISGLGISIMRKKFKNNNK